MKTVIIWDQLEAGIDFVIIEGDYRHLDRMYINHPDHPEEKIDELSKLMYDQTTWRLRNVHLKEFPTEIVKSGSAVIVCGFLP
jgi:hypothetical protein